MPTTPKHAATAFFLGTFLGVDDVDDDDTDGTEVFFVLGLSFPTGSGATTLLGFTGS